MTEPSCTVSAETSWVSHQRRWASGWRRAIFGGVFLGYLVEVVGALVQYNGPPGEAAGSLLPSQRSSSGRSWPAG